ncbi:MAG: TetR/AcrR family transcriptional regulator [Pseudomonadota bacterium]
MPRTKGKTPLSEDRILRAAVAYADDRGLDSLNVRRLARQLSAGAMSLYHYFASKDALLDAMVEWVAAQIPQPEADVGWREAITQIAMGANAVMIRHPWVCSIWSKRTLGPSKLAYLEAILRVLREGGFSLDDARDAYCAITVHIEGFALQAAEFPIKPEDFQSAAADYLASIEEAESIPYFVELVQRQVDHPTATDPFAMVLEMILDGFEARVSSD